MVIMSCYTTRRYLSIYLPIYLPTYPSIYLSFFLSFFRSFFLSFFFLSNLSYILSYLILSCLILAYLILSYPIYLSLPSVYLSIQSRWQSVCFGESRCVKGGNTMLICWAPMVSRFFKYTGPSRNCSPPRKEHAERVAKERQQEEPHFEQ